MTDDHSEALERANSICAALRAVRLGATATLPYPADEVRRMLYRHMRREAHFFHVTPGVDDTSAVVLRGNRQRKPLRPAGRPVEAGSARSRMLSMQPGDVLMLEGYARQTLAVEASRIRSRGLGAFKIAYSDQVPGIARVTRTDGVFTTDGHGNTVELATLRDRTPYPFRTMKPGDRFIVGNHLHDGLQAMRKDCARYSKLIGYRFEAAAGADDSIIVACTYQPETWVSNERKVEVAVKLKHQAPQAISELWE